MSNKMQTNHWISCRKSLEILGFAIVVDGFKATQRQSSLTFHLWELQMNLKRSLKVVSEIVMLLSHLVCSGAVSTHHGSTFA